MNSVEKIEEEYKNFKPKSNYIKTPEDLIDLIDIKIDEIDKDIVEIDQEMKKSEFKKIISSIKNKILFGEDFEYYEQDYDLMKEEYQLGADFIEYFRLIIDKISNNNYQELLRLSEFTEKHYFSNFDYLISERSNLALYYRGIRTMNINDDTRKTFKAFFSNKINEFHKEKGVEKHKKI